MALIKPKLVKPEIGKDLNVWGDKLNENIDSQDSFNQKIIDSDATQDQELVRLEEQKIGKGELDTLVQNTIDNYIVTNVKPDLGNHVENVNKPDLDRYTTTKTEEINTFTDEEKKELDVYEKNKEDEINSHTISKKTEIDTHTTEKESELDMFKQAKEQELETFTGTKTEALTAHADAELERMKAGGLDTKQDKTDNALNTNSKTIVGAINEVNSNKVSTSMRSSAIDSQSETNVANSKAVATVNANKAEKTINLNAGKGLIGGGDLSANRIFNVVSADEGIIVNEDNIKLNVVDDLTTGGAKRALSAEQGKVLQQKIEAINVATTMHLMKGSEKMGEYDYQGTLVKGTKTITVGKILFNPTLYLDGSRIEATKYDLEANTGTITLKEIYSEQYDTTYVVEDEMPNHITFCFPTMDLLKSTDDALSRIEVGDIIKILGRSDADDGGHYLVKCELTAKLNAVDIGEGRFLNEIPNTNIKTIADKTASLETGKFDKTGGRVTGVIETPSHEQFKGWYAGTNVNLNTMFSDIGGTWSYETFGMEGTTLNKPPTSNNANGLLTFNTHNGAFGHQISMSSDSALYHRVRSTSGIGAWNKIYTEAQKPTAKAIGAVPTYNSEDFLGIHKSGTQMHWYQEAGTYKTFWDSGNFNPSTKLNIKERTNWSTDPTILKSVIGQLAWKKYGSNHTIFDASDGTNPQGQTKSNVDPDTPWAPYYPTLMGVNNAGNTFGVRVDIARKAEQIIGFDPNTKLNTTGGALTGALDVTGGIRVINNSNGLIIQPSQQNKQSYLMGRDYDNSNIWFLGKGSDGNFNTTWRNYKHSTEIVLKANEVTTNKKLASPSINLTSTSNTLVAHNNKDTIGMHSTRGYYIGDSTNSNFIYSGSTSNKACVRVGNDYGDIYHTKNNPVPIDMNAMDYKLIGRHTLHGNLPEAGGTNTFTITLPAPADVSCVMEFVLYVGSEFSYTNVTGSEAVIISFVASGAAPSIQVQKITPMYNSSQGKYFTYSDLRRDTDGIHLDIHYSGNRNVIQVFSSFRKGSYSPYARMKMHNLRVGTTVFKRNDNYLASGGILTGIPELKFDSPYMYFSDTRADAKPNRSWIGFGSTTPNRFIIRNEATTKSLSLMENGDLKYNEDKIYHEGFKPSATDVGAVSNNILNEMNKLNGFFAYLGTPTSGETPSNGVGFQSKYAENRRGQIFVAPGNKFYSRFSQRDEDRDNITPWATHYTTLFKPTPKEIKCVERNNENYAPVGTTFYTSGMQTQGTKIRLPFGFTHARMVVFTVRIYQSYFSYDIKFSGYLYPSTGLWHAPKAIMLSGENAIQVRMGKDDDGRAYVWVGGGNYRGVAVIDVVGGHTEADWNEGWEIEISDECPNRAVDYALKPPTAPVEQPDPWEDNFDNDGASSRYMKFKNGMIMQWGYFPRQSPAEYGVTGINFPILFEDTKYSIIATLNVEGDNPSGFANDTAINTNGRSEGGINVKTYMKAGAHITGISYLAIGR